MTEAERDTRLDIWLWRARFFKTRALATAHVARKGVRITRNGQTRKTDKAGQRVSAGDVLTFSKAKAIEMIEIIGVGERRGPAPEAQSLYRRLEPGA
ncbi:MAG: RNA-binding S4 domain-containing protein [Pseudomonadota bacterium]